jgi:hypothetical protein
MGEFLPGLRHGGEGRHAKRAYLPSFQMIRVIPAPFLDSVQARRMHEKSVRDALQFAMLDYWRNDFQKHFRASARGEFQHRDRARPYKSIKRKETGSITDIVRSGATKTRMTHVRPRFKILTGAVGGIKRGGTGTGSRFGTTGALELTFPFATSTTRVSGGKWERKDGQKKITPSEIARELERWSGEAMHNAAACYMERYKKCLEDAFAKAPRWREVYRVDFERFKQRY